MHLHKLRTSKSISEKEISKHDELLSKLCDHCLPLIKEYYSITKLEASIAQSN
jgi:hypothetical protein